MSVLTTAYDAYFQDAAQIYGIPASLVKAHAVVESNLDPVAIHADSGENGSGLRTSYGLMQLEGQTARNLGFTGAWADLFTPGINIPLGAELIAQNLAAAGGDMEVAIAAYNEGIGNALADKAAGRPFRTTDPNYVAKVKTARLAFQALDDLREVV